MMIDFNETNRSLTTDFNSESERYLYRWYADYLVYRLFGLVIAFLGFLGGILSVVVFRQKSLRKRSCSVYFLNLALADLLCMSCWLVHFVLPTYNLQLLTLSNIFCKMFTFSMYFAFDLANYLLTVWLVTKIQTFQSNFSLTMFSVRSIEPSAFCFLFERVNIVIDIWRGK